MSLNFNSLTHPSEASVGTVANFLTSLFNTGRQVNTVRRYRLAVAAIHRGSGDGLTVSNAHSLDLLVRAMALKHPRIRSLAPPPMGYEGGVRGVDVTSFELSV